MDYILRYKSIYSIGQMNMQITMEMEKVTASFSLVIKAEDIFRINELQMYLLWFVQNYFVVSISSSNLNPN